MSEFDRTPEQRAEEAKRVEAEIERLKQLDAIRGGPPASAIRLKSDGGSFSAALERLKEKAATVEQRRRALPCFGPSEAGDDLAATVACEDANAFDACEFRETYAACPRKRAPELHDQVASRMTAAGVEERESKRILAAIKRREPFLELDSLGLVRAVLRRQRMRVSLDVAAEIREGRQFDGEALLTGTESIVVMGGNRGRGKTLAACYAIARLGGLYTVAGQWARPGGVDIAAAKRGAVLVVDQLGREHVAEGGGFMRAQLEEVLDARYAGKRLTFCVGNIVYAQFVERYDEVLADRIAGDGIFVLFGGESLRSGLRQAELAGVA